MRTTLKIAGLSAVLAAILVTAVDLPRAAATVPTGKAFLDRLPEGAAGVPARATPPAGDALRDRPEDPCARAVWPSVPRDCLAARGAPARAVRTITIERRDVPATSTLVRVPAAHVAAR